MSIFEQKKYENLAKKASENSKSSVDILIKMLKLASNQKPNLPDDVFYKKVIAQFDLEEEGKVGNEPIVLLSTSNIHDEQIKKKVDEYQREYSEISARGTPREALDVLKQRLNDLRNDVEEVIHEELNTIKEQRKNIIGRLKQQFTDQFRKQKQTRIDELENLIEDNLQRIGEENDVKVRNSLNYKNQLARAELVDIEKEIKKEVETAIKNNSAFKQIQQIYVSKVNLLKAIQDHYKSVGGTIKSFVSTTEKAYTDLTSTEKEQYDAKVKENNKQLATLSNKINEFTTDQGKTLEERKENVIKLLTSNEAKFAFIEFFYLNHKEIKPLKPGVKYPVGAEDTTERPLDQYVESFLKETKIDEDFLNTIFSKENIGKFNLIFWLTRKLKNQLLNTLKVGDKSLQEVTTEPGKEDPNMKTLTDPNAGYNLNLAGLLDSADFWRILHRKLKERKKEVPEFEIPNLLWITLSDYMRERKKIDNNPNRDERHQAHADLDYKMKMKMNHDFYEANKILNQYLNALNIPAKINEILTTVNTEKLSDKAKNIVEKYKQKQNLNDREKVEIEAFKLALASVYEAQITYDFFEKIKRAGLEAKLSQLGTKAAIPRNSYINALIELGAKRLNYAQVELVNEAAIKMTAGKKGLSLLEPFAELTFAQAAQREIKNYKDYYEQTPQGKQKIRKNIAEKLIEEMHPEIKVREIPIRFGLPYDTSENKENLQDEAVREYTRKKQYEKMLKDYEQKLQILYDTNLPPFQKGKRGKSIEPLY